MYSLGDNMPNSTYPVDPMAAFFAAVTAVENGSIGEIELEFNFMTSNTDMTMTMTVRREVKSGFTPLVTLEKLEE